jgi:hypothetical protein
VIDVSAEKLVLNSAKKKYAKMNARLKATTIP